MAVLENCIIVCSLSKDSLLLGLRGLYFLGLRVFGSIGLSKNYKGSEYYILWGSKDSVS